MPRTQLHYSDVLAWADEHRARTSSFPNAYSGIVVAKPDEKWANLDQALSKGLRGFPGLSSLAQLFAKWRGHRNRKRLPKYTLAGILRWADSHRRKTGTWPSYSSGPIEGTKGETWMAVENALRQGTRGLKGGSTLAKLLAERRAQFGKQKGSGFIV